MDAHATAPRWRIYRNPDCARCARYARMHQRLDWLHRLEVSTVTPASGALRMGEVVVEDLRSGVIHHGAAAFEHICCAIPLYAPLCLLLHIPAFRHKVDQEFGGNCGGDACTR
ncbi:MAG: hypothetical protein JWN73_2298 [Betaproteobacteria bacterium]|nr:hypothetical protein [Betaproteobacteria bacterium]